MHYIGGTTHTFAPPSAVPATLSETDPRLLSDREPIAQYKALPAVFLDDSFDHDVKVTNLLDEIQARSLTWDAINAYLYDV